jgi:hypothetical protein
MKEKIMMSVINHCGPSYDLHRNRRWNDKDDDDNKDNY